MKLAPIAKDALDRKKRGKMPYVSDSPVSAQHDAAIGGVVAESLVETDDAAMSGRLDVVKKFVNFVFEKLDIKSPVKISLVGNRKENGLKTFAQHDEQNDTSMISTENRHLGDVLRSVAHELVHKSQFEQKKINGPVQDIGGPIEDEANAVAGQLVKEFGYDNPEIFE